MNGVIQPQLFLDISGETSSFGDRGLLSIALDPDFATNNYVYIIYTLQPSTGINLARSCPRLPAVRSRSSGNARYLYFQPDFAIYGQWQRGRPQLAFHSSRQGPNGRLYVTGTFGPMIE